MSCAGPRRGPGPPPGPYFLLLLREERLLGLLLAERLAPLALARSVLPEELRRLELLRPLDAVPRLLLRDEEPDLEDGEELRDAIACSLDWVEGTAVHFCECCGHVVNLGRTSGGTVGSPSPSA